MTAILHHLNPKVAEHVFTVGATRRESDYVWHMSAMRSGHAPAKKNGTVT